VKVTLALVTFRSASVLGPCLATFRQQAAAADLDAEVVVVDHSESAAEREAIAAFAPDQLLAQANRGYAAGLNRALERATGEILLLGNPDLRFEAGAVGALVGALENGWHLVGPQFTLGPFLHPPAEPQTLFAELGRQLARLGLGGAFAARSLRQSTTVWQATEPVPQRALSGALLATTRATVERLGAWDEGYFLYFEEMDWLARAHRAGQRVALVPGARVAHAWGHSADPASLGQVHQASRQRYYQRHAGRAAWRLLAALDAYEAPPPVLPPWDASAPAAALGEGPLLALVSPSPWGSPAAGLVTRVEALEPALDAFAAAHGHPRSWVLSLHGSSPPHRLLGRWRWPAPPPPLPTSDPG
jgi:N-acetylglucosaminyl-diphospho-decaprenol L-rhamnosyltransferase